MVNPEVHSRLKTRFDILTSMARRSYLEVDIFKFSSNWLVLDSHDVKIVKV